MMILMIHLNLLSGPDSSNARLTQFRSTMITHYNEFTSATSPGFNFYAGRIIAELGDRLETHDGETLHQCAWRYAKDRAIHRKVGQKCCKARYNAVMADSLEAIPHWTLDLFETQHVCIEYDFIPRKALAKIPLACDVPKADGAAPKSTKEKLGQCEKTLRNSGANAVAIALQLLGDGSHHRVIVSLTSITRPSISWSGEASRSTRNVTSSQQWFKKQLDHGLVDCLYDTLDVLLQTSFLTDAGFMSAFDPADSKYDPCEITFDDEHADLAGTAALTHCRNRIRRTLWMRGWPHPFTQAIGENDACWKGHLNAFELDIKIDKEMARIVNPDKVCKEYIDRSRFKTPSVQQVRLARRISFLSTP